jgi:hypothetical protein
MQPELKTLSIPEAGRRYFDLVRDASYRAAKRGELPIIKVGSRFRVPVVALERMLDETRPKGLAHKEEKPREPGPILAEGNDLKKGKRS